jgi:exodeoxyribonuclease V alpha subunit
MRSSQEKKADMKALVATTDHTGFTPFIDAKIFTVTEIHAAVRIADVFFPNENEQASFLDYLSVAVAVWAPINGHVCVNLADVEGQISDEIGSSSDDSEDQSLNAVVWPDAKEWIKHLQESRLVAHPDVNSLDDVDYTKPLLLHNSKLYLTRQWADEGLVAMELRQRLGSPPTELPSQAAEWITPIFGKDSAETNEINLQAEAVRKALTHNTSVLLGGPGTGKTYTIAGMLHALFSEHASSAQADSILRVAIAAPTAKAARQVTSSVEKSLKLAQFPLDHQEAILNITRSSSTIHRLLGFVPGNRGRFAHHSQNKLPYDVVIIDEVSMVSLPLMARVLESLAPTTKLVLVGDPQQLKSVESGAVLPDIASLHGQQAFPITKLLFNRRQENETGKVNAIGVLATMISEAELNPNATEDIIKFLEGGHSEITFVSLPDTTTSPTKSSILGKLEPFFKGYEKALEAAKAGNAEVALTALASIRVLCGHRQGPFGVSDWNDLIANKVGVRKTVGSLGQPLLNTRNDSRTGLANGDTGIVVMDGKSRKVCFANQTKTFEPTALENIEVAFATTIHKSQGSEFETVVVIVPRLDSPLLRRELLYTAVTRARKHLVIVGSQEAITEAINRPIVRASGLADRISH